MLAWFMRTVRCWVEEGSSDAIPSVVSGLFRFVARVQQEFIYNKEKYKMRGVWVVFPTAFGTI